MEIFNQDETPIEGETIPEVTPEVTPAEGEGGTT